MGDDHGVRVTYEPKKDVAFLFIDEVGWDIPSRKTAEKIATAIRKAIADARAKALDEAIAVTRKRLYLKKGDPAKHLTREFQAWDDALGLAASNIEQLKERDDDQNPS